MKDPVVAVGLPNHAMAESVGSSRKLDRHIGRLLKTVELTPVVKDPRDDPGFSETFHKIVEHHPLIVPCYCLACLGKDIGWRCGRSRDQITNLVVELQEGEMRLSDEQVFIVAMVADQSEAFRAAGKIVAEVPSDAAEIDIDILADEQFGAVLARILRVAGIQMRAAVRPKAVNCVKIQAWGSEVLNAERILVLLGKGSQIESDVMVDELSQVGEACRDMRVVASGISRIRIQHRGSKRLQLGITHL